MEYVQMVLDVFMKLMDVVSSFVNSIPWGDVLNSIFSKILGL